MEKNHTNNMKNRVTESSKGTALHLNPMVSAAWLYYEDQLKQSDIAEILGVSRATVINYLNEARLRGIVEIKISDEHLASMRLAQAIMREFGLERCIVIPDDQGQRPTALRVGEAGAQLLSSLIAPNDVLGVSWGQTVLALSHAITRHPVADLTVIQITGSMHSTYEFSPELCTSNIADRYRARCINLHAPFLLSRPEIKEMLCNEPALMPQLALLNTCTKIVFGVGNTAADSTIFSSNTVTYAAVEPYRQQGAVAIIAGRYIDATGAPIYDHLDDRMIGLTFDEIDQIPVRICVAGGLNKVEAIRATLKGQHATVLVTDEVTACALMTRAKTP